MLCAFWRAILVANSSTTRFGTITCSKSAVIIEIWRLEISFTKFFLIIFSTSFSAKSFSVIPTSKTFSKVWLALAKASLKLSLSDFKRKSSTKSFLEFGRSKKTSNFSRFWLSGMSSSLIFSIEFCSVLKLILTKLSSVGVKIGSTLPAASFFKSSVLRVSITVSVFCA